MTDDRELEQLMRAGLEGRAAEVDTAAPVAARVRAATRRRRVGRVAAGAAALAVAAAAVTGVVVDRSPGPAQTRTPGVVDEPSGDPAPAAWRTEYWHDVQVDVTADWGWGTAPAAIGARGPRDVYLCGGPGAMITAGGRKLANPDESLPYVGRSIMLSDLCMGFGDQPPSPRAPYVWLGGLVEPGIVDVGNGYTEETREVSGSTVTVATRDAALRERILDSATGGETCFSELEEVPTPEQSSEIEGSTGLDPDSLTVCAYRRDEVTGTFALAYAAVLDRARARALVTAADAAPRVATGCPPQSQPGREFVQLTLEGPGPGGDAFREYTVGFGCGGLTEPGGGRMALTSTLVDPWAVGGIRVTLFRFIGMLG
jgi:hypothetical protein